MDVTPSRTLNGLYIVLDIIWLVIFVSLLIFKKRYITLIFALFGGVLYFAVDYGIFYSLLHTRVVEGASPFWFLLWLSFSYGITNFAWIWLWLSKDKDLLMWSLLIPIAWFSIALISKADVNNATGIINIYRGTGDYHYIMAIFLVVGYFGLIIHNLFTPKEKHYPILWILAIGILVQFSWEAILLVTGIRALDWQPLVIDSLLETNMGLPYIFMIYLFVSRKRNDDLTLKVS